MPQMLADLLDSPVRRGFAAQVFGLVSILVIQLLQVPIFIEIVGAARYGAYLVLIAVPSALTLSDFGLLSATSTRLMALLANSRLAEARALSRFANSVVAYISSFLFITTSVVVLSSNIINDSDGSTEAKRIVILYSLYAVLSVISSAFEGSMRAAGAYAGAWVRLGLMRMADFAASAVVLYISKSLVLAVLALCMCRIAGLVLLKKRLSRVAPWNSWKLVLPRPVMAPGLLRPTIGALCLPVGFALANQGALLAVASLFGPIAVVVFSTARTMVNLLRQLMSAIANASLPSITLSLARQNPKLAWAQLFRAFRVSSCIVIVGGIVFGLLGPSIISVWTNHKINTGSALICAFCFQVLVESTWLLLSLWFLAQNRQLGFSAFYTFSAGAYVGLLVLLRPSTLAGVAYIQVGCSLMVLLWVVILLSNDRRRLQSVAFV